MQRTTKGAPPPCHRHGEFCSEFREDELGRASRDVAHGEACGLFPHRYLAAIKPFGVSPRNVAACSIAGYRLGAFAKEKEGEKVHVVMEVVWG